MIVCLAAIRPFSSSEAKLMKLYRTSVWGQKRKINAAHRLAALRPRPEFQTETPPNLSAERMSHRGAGR